VKIALLGTRGVPAQYGGFETAAEEIGARLATRGHEVVVYCRNQDQHLRSYRGMRLVNLPAIRHRAMETLSHTLLSAIHASTRRFDCAILFNAANAPALPLLRMPSAVHMDGLEWRRAKWQGTAQRYLRWSERRAVNGADAVIADARGIQTYVRETYNRESVFIPYGAPILNEDPAARPAIDVQPGEFHLLVARIEPENSIELVLHAYQSSSARYPLVVIGDNPYPSEYLRRCIELLRASEQIIWLGSVWNQTELDWCYANCLTYLHGHTVGGTNPSLLRAMGAGAGVIARDVSFNREVCGPDGEYFSDEDQLIAALMQAEREPSAAVRRGGNLRHRASREYRWDAVAEAYEDLCADLSARKSVPA